jgi:hypothetical protein
VRVSERETWTASSGSTPRCGGLNHGTASIVSCGHGKTPRR